MTSQDIINLDQQAAEEEQKARLRDPVGTLLADFLERMPDLSSDISAILEKDGDKKSPKTLETKLRQLMCKTVKGIIGETMAVNDFHQSKQSDQDVWLFTGTHWCMMSHQSFLDFALNCCLRCGLPEEFAYEVDFMNKLFVTMQFRVMGERKHQEPEGCCWINLLNGTLEINHGGTELHFREHDLHDWFTYCLPYRYEPDAECPRLMQFLDQVLPEKEAQQLLQEHFGYCLSKNGTLKMERALILYGVGANGKSVVTDLLISALGRENVSSVDLALLTTLPEYRFGAVGKLANISQENSSGIQWSVLKNIVSGESVTVREYYHGPVSTNDFGKIIAVYNELPRPENTYACFRRWNIIPFQRVIPEEQRDIHLIDKLREELPAVLNWMIQGLVRLIQNKAFTQSPLCQQTLNDYMVQSNSALSFYHDQCVIDEEALMQGSELYARYKTFCMDEGYRNPFGKNNFFAQLATVGVSRRKTHGNWYLNVKIKQ